MTSNGKKAILLLSGGLDSVTALYWALGNQYKIIALSINYYLRPEREKEVCKRITELTNVDLIEIDLPFLKEVGDLRKTGFQSNIVIDSPEGLIPSRNLIFYSIATYYAIITDAKTIIGGHLVSDPTLFPDSSSEFFKKFHATVQVSLNDNNAPKVVIPLSSKNKKEVIITAKELKVPFEHTWSCYHDGKKHCGKCPSCKERIKAFEELKLNDPVFPSA
jgi:7-cyano-7-deazaguanine synthase